MALACSSQVKLLPVTFDRILCPREARVFPAIPALQDWSWLLLPQGYSPCLALSALSAPHTALLACRSPRSPHTHRLLSQTLCCSCRHLMTKRPNWPRPCSGAAHGSPRAGRVAVTTLAAVPAVKLSSALLSSVPACPLHQMQRQGFAGFGARLNHGSRQTRP